MSDIMRRHESLVFYIKFLEKQLQHFVDFSNLNMHHHLLQIIKSIILNFFCNLASVPVAPRFILIFQQHHGENKLHFDEMMMMPALC
jgi:hypothetical protein